MSNHHKEDNLWGLSNHHKKDNLLGYASPALKRTLVMCVGLHCVMVCSFESVIFAHFCPTYPTLAVYQTDIFAYPYLLNKDKTSVSFKSKKI
jgi:hypothetical protein